MTSHPHSDGGALDELVAQALAAIESDGDAGLERVIAAHPQLAAALRARIAALRAAGLLEAPGVSAPERLGPFKLLRPLGAGGMGIVYLALQEDLGREVALKVIRPEQMYFPGARKRFRREVEIVASLQHPGIVPIHTVGDADGVPYFAMDLLRGETIAGALQRLAGRDVGGLTGADLAPDRESAGYLFAGSWEDACVRVIRQVAEALEHAHQRGVVHRDIKPSNILVTSDASCRAVLLDFGLAAAKGGGELTQSRALLGSLKYMAPEQARGALREVGPRSDIYSLGATLFELLTLRPAMDGDTETEVLRSIERGAAPRARALNARVSWELETVCLTALELDPARRYASAADMARDLDAVLASRPIEARRAGVARRAELYVRRNPARSAALLLLAVLVVGGPTLFGWQQRRTATVVAAQRDRAERNAARAREAVDRMLTRVGELDLRFVPQAETVRRDVLEDAIALLKEFVAEEGANLEARAEVARAHARLGALMGELGRSVEAAASYSDAIAVLTALRRTPRADERLENELSGARLARADALLAAGLGVPALELLDETEAELRAPGRAASARASLARTLRLRGRALVEAGRLAEGREMFEQAARESDALLAADDAPPSAREEAFAAWNELGTALLRWFTPEGEGNPAAERALERALELGRRLRREAPDDPGVQHKLATALNNYAGALRRRSSYDEARTAHQEAFDELEDLTRRFPAALGYKLELATVFNQIGLSYDFEDATDMAEPYYARTVELLDELTRAAPHDATLWHRLGLACENLGAPLLVRGDVPRTVSLLRQGLEASRRALELAPDNVEFQGSMNVRCRRLTMTLLDAGDFRGAVESAQYGPQVAPGPWKSWTGAAVLLAQILERVRAVEDLDPLEREWLEQHCVERAVTMMRGAVEHGVPGTRDLRRLNDLRPLHGAPSFERFADELLAAQPSPGQ